jgi:hypothetical protein
VRGKQKIKLIAKKSSYLPKIQKRGKSEEKGGKGEIGRKRGKFPLKGESWEP